MRFAFVVFALLGISSAVSVNAIEPRNDDFLSFAQEDEDKKDPEFASQVDPKDTDFEEIKKPFRGIEDTIDKQIADNRSKIRKSIKDVKTLNRKADDAIKDAKKADKDLALKIKEHNKASEDLEKANKTMEEAKKKAKKQHELQRNASKLKQMAVVMSQDAARKVEAARGELNEAQSAKQKVEEHLQKERDIIQRVTAEVNSMAVGTQSGKETQ